MLTTDTNMELRINRFSKFDSHLHQFANTSLIQFRETDRSQRSWCHSKHLRTYQHHHERIRRSSESGRWYRSRRTQPPLRSRRQSELHAGSRSWYLPRTSGRMPAAAISASAVSTTTFLTNFSSLTSPTSGIMISGLTFQSACSFFNIDSCTDDSSWSASSAISG